MFAKIMLVVVFFTPAGDGYHAMVGAFDTKEECEAMKAQVIAHGRRSDPSAFVFASCVKPRPVVAVDA